MAKPALWKGQTVKTGIFKTPVNESLFVSINGIETDEQADLRVHGGKDKAVYAYDISYYHHWKKILQRDDWSYGLFGENLTTENLPDDKVKYGDIYQVGSCKLMPVQPRFPCTKINIKFGLTNMVEHFVHERKSGIYFRVIEEGKIKAGDIFELIERSPHDVTIQDLTDAYYSGGADQEMLHRILAINDLPDRIKRAFMSYI